GFDRAACCLGEDFCADDHERPIQLTNFQFHFHMLADDPVRDAARAEQLADLILARKKDDEPDEYPERHLLHMAKASARIGQRDGDGAARELDAAASTAGDVRFASMLRREAAAARRGPVDPEAMGQHFIANVSSTRFLHEITEREGMGLEAGGPGMRPHAE